MTISHTRCQLGLFLSVLLAIAFVAQALPRRPFAMTSAFFPKQYQRNDNCPSVWIHQQLRGGAQEEEDDEESDEETDDERDEKDDIYTEDEADEEETDGYDDEEYDDEYDEEELEEEEESNGKSSSDVEYMEPYFVSPQLQLYTTFGSMIIANKVKLFSPAVVRLVRFLFIAQLVAQQLFIFYVRIMAKKNNDRTPVKTQNVLSGMLEKQMGQQENDMVKNLASSFLNSETTVMEYDMKQASSMQGSVLFNMAFNWFLHFKMEKVQPLLMQVVSGTMQLIYHPLFQVYVLGRNLERPFKSQTSAAQKLMQAQEQKPNEGREAVTTDTEEETEDDGDEYEDTDVDEEEDDSDADEENDSDVDESGVETESEDEQADEDEKDSDDEDQEEEATEEEK